MSHVAALRRILLDTEQLDATGWRETQLERRLETFANRQRMAQPEVLAEIERDRDFRRRFLDHMTINVTSVYRDPERWRYLEDLLRTDDPARLRIWSAGCACGAEAVSLSIVTLRAGREAWVLATDIDKVSLDRARTGRFNPVEIKDLPVDIKDDHFDPDGDALVARDDVLSQIRVRRHNLLDDDYPPGTYDLIACRNVLIYFGDEARDTVHRRLTESLSPDGLLFTGSAERVRRPRDLGLEPVDSQFYRKVAA